MPDDRQVRIQAIADAAIVRAALGQATQHDRLPDGSHRVMVFDRAAGTMRQWTAGTLAEALRLAQGAGQEASDHA